MSVAWFDSVTLTVEVAFATAPFAVTPTWTDVSAYLRSIDVKPGGRATGLDQFQAGIANIEFDNSDRRFDPLYASGAYYPNVLPRKKVRVSATYSAVTYRLFTGFVDAWPQVGEMSNRLGLSPMTATDGFKMLSRNRLPIDPMNPVGAGETVAARMGRLLDYAGWPAADRDLDTDSPALDELVPNGQPIMDEMYSAANGDLGQIFIAGDGKFTYRGHRWQLANNLTASATLGDGAGELGYSAVTVNFDDSLIFNRAKGQCNVNGVTLTTKDITDSTSITAYGESARDIGLVGVTNLNVLQNTLEWIVANYKDAKLRGEQVMLLPRSSPAAIFPVVLGAANGTRWTLNRRPQNVGSAISQDVIVEQVSHAIGLDRWESTFTLSQAPASPSGTTYWRMGVSTWDGNAYWA